MGRHDVLPTDDERWVFNRLAEQYARRPAYPPELVTRIASLVPTGARVVDLGAGTGLLSVALARAGFQVTAVEPARAMLQALERAAAGLEVQPVHAAAEATGLSDRGFDLVVLADAIQWVDPARAGTEAARLLRSDGLALIVDPAFADTPFMREVAEVLAANNPKARRENRAASIEQFLSLAAGQGMTERAQLRHEVALQDDALEAVLRSLSFVGPALGEGGVRRLVEAVWSIAQRHGGAVWARDVRLSWRRRSTS